MYLPRGGLVQGIEDSDIVLDGLAIVERDGIYEEGEMEGNSIIENLDGAGNNQNRAAVSRSWPGKVRQH